MDLDRLKPLDLDVEPFYADQAHAARNVHVTLHEDQTMRRQATARQVLDMSGVQNAAEQLDRLPVEGESIHGIMRGNFAGFDFVPAIIRLAGGRRVTDLNIATLGFNEKNLDALLALMDAGQVNAVTFIASHFYKTHEGEVFDRLHAELSRRGGRCLAMRCHAKLIMFEFEDGPCYALEMSANLRSCNNLEQFVLTRDRDLVEFHRAWMKRLIQEAGG